MMMRTTFYPVSVTTVGFTYENERALESRRIMKEAPKGGEGGVKKTIKAERGEKLVGKGTWSSHNGSRSVSIKVGGSDGSIRWRGI
jgi:hypothetical protein